jgi:thioredoxin 1
MAEITVSDKTFDDEVIKSEIPVLVDFWAVWCGPCQMQNPILEEVAKEFEGKAKVAKLNVDENPNSAAKYGIMSIPTLIIFKDGNMVKQMIGVQSKEILEEELNRHIS